MLIEPLGKLPSKIDLFGIELKQIQREDIEMVREWRNHPDVAMYMLSQDDITPEQQRYWFEQLQQSTSQQCFVAYYNNEPMGIANCKAIESQRLHTAQAIEPGVYMAPESRYRGTIMAFAPAMALNQSLFEYTECEKLVACVKVTNNGAIRFNKMMGYEQIPTDEKDLVRMHLSKDNFLKAKEKIAHLLRF